MAHAESLDGDGIGDGDASRTGGVTGAKASQGDRQAVAPSPAHGCGDADGTKSQIPDYWFPKVTGRLLSERLGRWHFWLFVVWFNLTFLPMHWAGMLGMPRRIYTYPADRGWDFWNLIASLGVPFQAAAVLVFLVNVAISLLRGARAGGDPWDAWTLEWATASPPPPYNFETAPVVASRRPLWDVKHPDDPDGPHE